MFKISRKFRMTHEKLTGLGVIFWPMIIFMEVFLIISKIIEANYEIAHKFMIFYRNN